MKSRFASVYFRLMKYALLLGFLGGVASFIGPPNHGLIKAGIGIVVGAMLLGDRVPEAMKELRSITDEISDEMLGK